MKSNLSKSFISLPRVILSLVLLNTAGYALKYFELDTYFIFIGFRFHLSFVLPVIILLLAGYLTELKEILLKPIFKRKIVPIIWIILSFGIVFAALYLLDKAELGDPEYFYEFGLSSIFDYPLYLIWNFPQFLLLFSFLFLAAKRYTNKFVPVFLCTIFLFVYELIPVDFSKDYTPEYLSYFELLLSALCAGFLFQFYNNVYWFTAVIFSLFWFNLLAFGSKTTALINILFASQYSEWEGFFIADKEVASYLLIAQLLILILLLLLSLPFRNSAAIHEKGEYDLNPSNVTKAG